MTSDNPSVSYETAARLRVAVARLARSLRQTSPGGLSPSQWSALVSVDEANSLRIGDLADREGVSAPTATRLVASLEELNLISRAADPADRRTAYVALTGEGRSKLDWARSAASADLADRLASLSPTEVGRLAELIPLLESLVAND